MSGGDILVAHPGTQHAPLTAVELQRRGRLLAFCTGIAYRRESALGRLLDSPLLRSWSRHWRNRGIHGLGRGRLSVFPGCEWRYLRSVPGPETTRQALLHRRNGDFQRRVCERSWRGLRAVVGYDTSSWILAEWCRARGIPLVLERTIGHPAEFESISRQLARRHPAWHSDFTAREPEVAAAEEREHAQAAVILVGGSFAAETLVRHGVDRSRIVVSPYGVSLERFPFATGGWRGPRTRILFAGSVTPRKGVPELLEAWREAIGDQAELVIAGPCNARNRQHLEGVPGVRYLGPQPHDAMPALFASCDAFVLPSHFEGFPRVMLEALACGLPLISTPACSARDLFAEGEAGWEVGAGDVNGLIRILGPLARREVSDLPARRVAARRAVERLTWEAFGKRLVQAVDRSLGREEES